MRGNIPPDCLGDVVSSQEPQSIRGASAPGDGRGGDVGVRIFSSARCSARISLPNRVIYDRITGAVPGHGIKRVIQRGK